MVRGFAVCLARDQRITPYMHRQHTNSLVELVETNILFFTGFAFDRLSLPRAGRPTTGRQAYHGQAGQPDRQANLRQAGQPDRSGEG